MEISKNSKFYISPEEMVAKFKDRRNINILCFNKLMNLMVEYPHRVGRTYMNYYFSAIVKYAVNPNDSLLYIYKFGIKNKKGDIIFKNFCFTNVDKEYSALEKAIEWYATSSDNQLNDSYKIMIKNEIGDGLVYNTANMKVLTREEYGSQVSEVYSALERENGWGV